MALLNKSCWGFYVNEKQKNETDRNKIKTHLKLLHEEKQGSPLNPTPKWVANLLAPRLRQRTVN